MIKEKYCRHCKESYSVEAEICPKCRAKLVPAEDLTDQDQELTYIQPESRYEYASPYKRLVAFLLDIGVLYTFWEAFWTVISIIYIRTDFRILKKPNGFLSYSWLIFYFPYAVILTRYFGATVGKNIMKIFIISSDKVPLTWKQVLYRETIGKIVSLLFLGLGYVDIFFNKKRQTAYDKIARTYVMQREKSFHLSMEYKKGIYEIIRCPHCNIKFDLKESKKIIKITCPSCGYSFPFITRKKSLFDKIIDYLNTGGEFKKIEWYHHPIFVLLVFLADLYAGKVVLLFSPAFKRYLKILIIIFVLIYFWNYLFDFPFNKQITKPTSQLLIETWKRERGKADIPKLDPSIKIKLVGPGQEKQLTVPQIYAEKSKSIVTIETFDDENKRLERGTGFIISDDGFIVTNYHIIDSAKKAVIKNSNGETLKNTIYASEHTSAPLDIAVLKVDARYLSALYLGDSDKVTIGEDVVTIGNSIGLENTISSGIISAIRVFNNQKLIQHTAPTSRGNSGGPLFNRKGEVIGIINMSASAAGMENIGLAIPINYLKDLIKDKGRK